MKKNEGMHIYLTCNLPKLSSWSVVVVVVVGIWGHLLASLSFPVAIYAHMHMLFIRGTDRDPH